MTLARHFPTLTEYSNKIKFRNTVDYKKLTKKRNDVSVSSWHHYQVKNVTEKIIYTESKGVKLRLKVTVQFSYF